MLCKCTSMAVACLITFRSIMDLSNATIAVTFPRLGMATLEVLLAAGATWNFLPRFGVTHSVFHVDMAASALSEKLQAGGLFVDVKNTHSPATIGQRGTRLWYLYHIVRVRKRAPVLVEPLGALIVASVLGPVAATGGDLRHAEDHESGGANQAGFAGQTVPGQSGRQARLGIRGGLRRGDVAHATAGSARGLRDCHRGDPFHSGIAGRGVRSGRDGLGKTRRDRSKIFSPGRGGSADRRRDQGQNEARVEADGRLSRVGPDDGRSRCGTRAPDRRGPQAGGGESVVRVTCMADRDGGREPV